MFDIDKSEKPFDPFCWESDDAHDLDDSGDSHNLHDSDDSHDSNDSNDSRISSYANNFNKTLHIIQTRPFNKSLAVFLC